MLLYFHFWPIDEIKSNGFEKMIAFDVVAGEPPSKSWRITLHSVEQFSRRSPSFHLKWGNQQHYITLTHHHQDQVKSIKDIVIEINLDMNINIDKKHLWGNEKHNITLTQNHHNHIIRKVSDSAEKFLINININKIFGLNELLD